MKHAFLVGIVLMLAFAGISSAAAPLVANQSITNVLPQADPASWNYGISVAMMQLGQGWNQFAYGAGLEGIGAYISNNNAYVLENEREVYQASLELQSGTLTTSGFNSTVVAISSNVNSTLQSVNSTGLTNPSIYSNASNANMVTSFLMGANASYNSEAVQIDAVVAPIVAPSQATQIIQGAQSNIDSSSTPDIVPAVTDPPPGAIVTRATGTPYAAPTPGSRVSVGAKTYTIAAPPPPAPVLTKSAAQTPSTSSSSQQGKWIPSWFPVIGGH